MHACISRLRIRPGAVEQAIHCFEERVIPTARDQRGFFGALLLIDRDSATAYSISLWGTAADIAYNACSGSANGQLEVIGGLLAGPPEVEIMEVCVQD